MRSRRFYDVLSLVFIILVIGCIYFSNSLTFSAVSDAMKLHTVGSSVSNIASNDLRVVIADYLNIGYKVLVVIYWLFILVLALQFHREKVASTLDVVIIAIVIPLAIVFYFLTLRGKYKKL
jgi:hypothetical protein